MTMECSPELADMVRRCALPIEVLFFEGMTGGGEFLVETTYVSDHYGLYRDPAEATSAYLALVSTLETESAASTSAVTGDGCSAPASPGGES